ncbi:MAG: HNH endonuclease [Thermoleophilia bacterium]|nr:HNH endonuclease [Thermoleophilia bacterium]
MAQRGTGDYAYRRRRTAFLADNPVCAWCGYAQATTVDHLVPIDMGGERNDVTSWVPACRSCNSRRGAQYGNAKRREAAAQADHRAARAEGERLRLDGEAARRRGGKPCIGFAPQPSSAGPWAD